MSKATKVGIVFQSIGMVAINFNDFLIISSYISPNIKEEEVDRRLVEIDKIINTKKWAGVIWAGDLNGKSPIWGSKDWNLRGKKIIELVVALNIIPIYTSGGNTCIKGNGSKVDIIIADPSVASEITSSTVLPWYTGSDHLYLLHNLRCRNNARPERNMKINNNKIQNKNDIKIDTKKLVELFLSRYGDDRQINRNIEFEISDVKVFMNEIRKMCVKCRKGSKISGKMPVYWWNEEIALLRKVANKARRKVTRVRKYNRTIDIVEATRDYKIAKRNLNQRIKKAKKDNWDKLIQTVDQDIWGRPYKIVMKQLKPNPPPIVLNLTQTEEITRGLFILEPPAGEGDDDEIVCWNQEMDRVLTRKENLMNEQSNSDNITAADIIIATKKIAVNKAPGPDGVPAAAAKEIGIGAVEYLQKIFNTCIEKGFWPEEWKETRLVLLPKGKSNPSQLSNLEKINPSEFRPLCIASNLAKIFEHIIKTILNKQLEKNDLSIFQYGFRKDLSTVHAMSRVMELWDTAKKEGRHCLMILLDVKNAFNTLRWGSIIRELQARQFPPKLVNLIKSYLKDRWLIIKASDGMKRIKVHGGVPQGSVIGPNMWNLVYDALLRLRRRRDVYIIAFADDINIIIIEKDLTKLEDIANNVIADIVPWFNKEGLELAPHKSVSILLTGRKCARGILVKIGNNEMKVGESAKYLGVTFEKNQTFKEHLKLTVDKAIRYSVHLNIIQTNVNSVGTKARILYYRVVESVIMYASPIWIRALKYSMNINLLNSVQRIPLGRIIRAYRTVSIDTLCVLSGFPPWHLLAKERTRIYERYEKLPKSMELKEKNAIKTEIKKEEYDNKMFEWQNEWNATIKGRWTYNIVPNIKEWIQDGVPMLDYHTVQVLTGHGCFGSYLKKIGKEEQSSCWFCEELIDDPKHTIFVCPRWEMYRRELEQRIYPISWEIRNIKFLLKNTKSNKVVREYIKKNA